MKRIDLAILCAAVFVLPLVVGCWSNYENTVTATVTYEDGAPVPTGTVSFTKNNFETFGKIENGRVNIGNMDGGVPDGTYKIAVRAFVQKSETDFTLESIVARKFEDPETSGIVIEVQGNKSIEIVVARP
ncbi:hypothetical protein M4951_12505 [Blastopirellula sp. J2-11]|uniref:hypothetical protein n=1 Tax=Blastopirellula sp. J2-11 TaxID=2943192 RepID=UPI0021C81FA0|nr:hypothetical protein [Blastopirellula sp. J2-11]UUO09104.1 hypothetical protein M4951_12505 [Blastopirellula sp. J2-11]